MGPRGRAWPSCWCCAGMLLPPPFWPVGAAGPRPLRSACVRACCRYCSGGRRRALVLLRRRAWLC
eukprot:556355-Alexandrium_andersonii.AAC.1